ncbi:MAG: hypothetical protein SOU37_02725, partial [Campylobacter lanienae]|nr:hypothetical protein [Campylobacteraceae bacterium]MDY2817514.1 hypothetical protein [Campylobacter lanienae]
SALLPRNDGILNEIPRSSRGMAKNASRRMTQVLGILEFYLGILEFPSNSSTLRLVWLIALEVPQG